MKSNNAKEHWGSKQKGIHHHSQQDIFFFVSLHKTTHQFIIINWFFLQIRTLPTLWRVNKPDFFIWVLTALVSILADLDLGLMAGVGFSLLTVLMVSQLATGTLLGKSEFEDVIMATDRKGVRPVPGVCIFK